MFDHFHVIQSEEATQPISPSTFTRSPSFRSFTRTGRARSRARSPTSRDFPGSSQTRSVFATRVEPPNPPPSPQVPIPPSYGWPLHVPGSITFADPLLLEEQRLKENRISREAPLLSPPLPVPAVPPVDQAHSSSSSSPSPINASSPPTVSETTPEASWLGSVTSSEGSEI